MNEIKKVFWMFFFENFIKLTKFSLPTIKLDSRSNSWEIFLFDVAQTVPVIANQALYWMDPTFAWK